MKAATVIMFLATMTVAKHHHTSLRKSFEDKNFFSKINEDIHGLMEKIFDCFNLNDNFTKEPNIKKLLTMHYDLSNIAEKNIESLHDVQNASQVSNINQTEDRVRLNNAVEQILKEKKLDVYEQMKGKKHKHKHDKHKTKIKSKTDASELSQSEELVNFVIDFLDQVNNVSLQDLRKSSKRRIRQVSYRRNLKVWEPPPNIKIHVNAKTRRVFNGMQTTIKKFPFIVSIHILGEFACAGSIISRDVIITAAACLQEAYGNPSKLNPKSIYVRLGSDYTGSDGETIPVQELHFHPDFEPDVLKNNLVLIRLEKRIRFSKQQNRIRRILYDTGRNSPDPDEEGVLILGWGSTLEDQTVDRNQKLSLDVLDLFNWDSCKNLYSENYVNDENFCAGMAEKRGGACNGDVGGPGVVGPILMGIVSFGAPVCGSSDAPTVFIKLGYYAHWIESVLKPKPERRQSMIWRDLFTRRNIGTSDNNRIYNSKSSRKKFRARDDYPEEVSVLREILSELVKSNTDMVDELLYGDLYEDFNDIFISKEKPDILQHALVNKSIYPIPEVHYDSYKEYVTVKLTTSPPTTMAQIDSFSNLTPEILRKPEFEYSDNRNDYTDNYENSSSEQGMSIEVFTVVTNEAPTNNIVTKHHKRKIKSITTTVRTGSTHKRKSKHHKHTTAPIAPIATRMTAPPVKKIKKVHISKAKHESAFYDKKSSDKIDETKAVASKAPEEYAEEMIADKKAYIETGIMEEMKENVQEKNKVNSKEKNEEEDNVNDYYNLADDYKNKIADIENAKSTEYNDNKEENKTNNKDYSNDNNKIADNSNTKVVIDENDNNYYSDDNIITGNKNDKVFDEEIIPLADNDVNLLTDYQHNKTDDTKEYSQNTNTNDNEDYKEDDTEPVLLSKEERSEDSTKEKKGTFGRDDKSVVRNLEDVEDVEISNSQKPDSVEIYQNVTSTRSTKNDESQRSSEYSFTPHTPFMGTHMDFEYITVGLKIEGKHIKSKKAKKPSTSEPQAKSPNFHAMRKQKQPTENAKLWEAFFNMKLLS